MNEITSENPNSSDHISQVELAERSTAEQIENISDMLGRRALDAGTYHPNAAFAQAGYDQIGRGDKAFNDNVALFINPHERGVSNRPRAIIEMVSKRSPVKAIIDTGNQSPEVVIINTKTRKKERLIEDEKKVRRLAASALWNKRNEVREAEKSKENADDEVLDQFTS
jgi:hypothetical protein